MNHPTRCPDCNSNLTSPGSIEVHLSSGSHQWDEEGQVDQSGTLDDPHGHVAKGLHAGSYCGSCGELLEELPETHIMNYPTKCPKCQSDLTKSNSVKVYTSNGADFVDEYTAVDPSGKLPGKYVESVCAHCRETLKQNRSRFRVLTFSNCEPWVSDPFPTKEERDAAAKSIFNSPDFTRGEDNIGWLDQYDNGDINVGSYTDDDLCEDTL